MFDDRTLRECIEKKIINIFVDKITRARFKNFKCSPENQPVKYCKRHDEIPHSVVAYNDIRCTLYIQHICRERERESERETGQFSTVGRSGDRVESRWRAIAFESRGNSSPLPSAHVPVVALSGRRGRSTVLYGFIAFYCRLCIRVHALIARFAGNIENGLQLKSRTVWNGLVHVIDFQHIIFNVRWTPPNRNLRDSRKIQNSSRTPLEVTAVEIPSSRQNAMIPTSVLMILKTDLKL